MNQLQYMCNKRIQFDQHQHGSTINSYSPCKSKADPCGPLFCVLTWAPTDIVLGRPTIPVAFNQRSIKIHSIVSIQFARLFMHTWLSYIRHALWLISSARSARPQHGLNIIALLDNNLTIGMNHKVSNTRTTSLYRPLSPLIEYDRFNCTIK